MSIGDLGKPLKEAICQNFNVDPATTKLVQTENRKVLDDSSTVPEVGVKEGYRLLLLLSTLS